MQTIEKFHIHFGEYTDLTSVDQRPVPALTLPEPGASIRTAFAGLILAHEQVK